MTLLAEGNWGCTVLSASFGETDKGVPRVQINVRIEDGPSAGRQTTYEDEVNAKSALYISRSCKAVGWKGIDLDTLKVDAAAWIAASGGKTTAEIKHIPIRNGKRAGETWDKCNSIGRGAKPLAAAKPETRNDANEAMRRAMAEDNSAPTGGGYVAEGHGAPAGNDDDLPFVVSCSTVSTGEIARVLRGAL